MNKSQILGYLRHLLTFGAGILVAKGKLDNETSEAIIGGVVAAAGFAWSHKKNTVSKEEVVEGK